MHLYTLVMRCVLILLLLLNIDRWPRACELSVTTRAVGRFPTRSYRLVLGRLIWLYDWCAQLAVAFL